MAVRILFLSPRNLTLRHLQDFSALFCCILLKLQFAVLAVFYVIHSGLIEEKDSNDFSSVHVFTQPGSKAEMASGNSIARTTPETGNSAHDRE